MTKSFLYVLATIALIVLAGFLLYVGQSSPGKGAEINDETDSGNNGVSLPAVTAMATPAETAVKEQTTISTSTYTPKFNPSGGENRQEMTLNNIPKSIPLAGGLVIRDLKEENDYFYGYVKNTANGERSLGHIWFTYLDKDGIRTRYSTNIVIRAYSDTTKRYRWVGAGDIPAGQEYYFRSPTMKKYDTGNEIRFLQIES